MNRKQKIIVSVTGIFLVLLILLGLTYAYFLTQIVGNTNEKSISVTTANLELTYGDGTTQILTSDTKLVPSADPIGAKYFTVTNTGDANTEYVVIIEDVLVKDATTGELTTFESNDFRYDFWCEREDGTVNTQGEITKGVLPLSDGIISNGIMSIGAGQTLECNIILYYIDTGVNQSADMNKTLEARINIEDPNRINPYSSNTNSLAYNIINNALNVTNDEINNKYAAYRKTPLTKPAEEASFDIESSLSVTSDDYTKTTGFNSYYYRGNVENNYLEFNDMCWRIVRIEGDGSVKLTLAKEGLCSTITDSDTESAFIGSGKYGSKGNGPYIADYIGSTSGMRSAFNTWLSNNFTSTTQIKNDNWCIGNMRDAYDSSGIIGTASELHMTGLSNYNFNYSNLYRLLYLKTSSLICETTDTEGELDTLNIGTLTADEIAFAGGVDSNINIDGNNFYLIKNSSNNWWTLSPTFYDSGYIAIGQDGAYILNTNGNLYYSLSTDSLGGVSSASHYYRPSISLISEIEIESGGTGTIDNPYVIAS